MTLEELGDLALGDDFDSSLRTTAYTFINQALGRIFRARRMLTSMARATVETVADTNTYLLPDDFGRFRDDAAMIVERIVIAPVEETAIDQAPARTGKPEVYALIEGAIVFYPTPDAEYVAELDYLAVPQLDVAEDATEVPPLPADQHLQLGLYARAKLYLLRDDPDMHDRLIATLPRELQLDRGADMHRVPKTRQVPGTWSRGTPLPRFHHPDGLF